MGRGKSKRPQGLSKTKWRDFEKMVARIEACLCPHGVKIMSPDYVADVVTGTMREVDASLRYQLGSSQVLITVECRDRKHVEDVQWIEQLATKKGDIKAAKCIAVSSAGFSKAAVLKASHHNIEIRLVQDVKDQAILAWFDNLYIDVEYHLFSIYGINFALETGGGMKDVQLADDLAAGFISNSWDSPIVFDRDADQWVGVQFFLDDYLKQGYELYDLSFPAGEKYRRNLVVRGTPPPYTRTNRGTFDLDFLEIALDITRLKERILLKDHLQYASEARPLAYAAQGNWQSRARTTTPSW